MHFPRWMHEAEKHARTNRDGILLVVDVSQVEVFINVVCEGLVSDLLRM